LPRLRFEKSAIVKEWVGGGRGRWAGDGWVMGVGGREGVSRRTPLRAQLCGRPAVCPACDGEMSLAL
jgi:hypothetical protein